MASAVRTGPAAQVGAAQDACHPAEARGPAALGDAGCPPARRAPARGADRRAPRGRGVGDGRRGQDDRGRRRRRVAGPPGRLAHHRHAGRRAGSPADLSRGVAGARRAAGARRRRPGARRRASGTSRPRACSRTPSATSGSCSSSTTWSGSARHASRGQLIDSLLRHGHSSLRAVLISRRDVPRGLSALRPSTGAMAAIGDEDLTLHGRRGRGGAGGGRQGGSRRGERRRGHRRLGHGRAVRGLALRRARPRHGRRGRPAARLPVRADARRAAPRGPRLPDRDRGAARRQPGARGGPRPSRRG